MRSRFITALMIAAGAAACTVSQTTNPDLAGPSGFGTSVTATAAPDILTMGAFASASGTTSVISASLRDASGNPIAGRAVHFDANVPPPLNAPPDQQATPIPASCGNQGAIVTTNASGIATTTFTAPGFPASGACSMLNGPVQINMVVTPEGTDFQGTSNNHAVVQLVLNRPQ